MVILLEVARGMAALWVFLFHVQGYFEESSKLLFWISKYGHLGVPMFFVISGYVITYSAESTLKNSHSPLSFLKKRFLRIYPVFWISVILILLVPYIIESISMLKSGYYVTPENKIDQFSFTEWLKFLSLISIFYSENGDLQGQFNVINSVYWTIAIEFQFYLAVTFALFFKSFYRLLIATITIFSFVNYFFYFNLNDGLFIHHWPSFSVGIGLAYLFKNEIIPGSISKNKNFKFAATSLVLFIPLTAFLYKFDSLIFAIIFALILWMISPAEKNLNKINSQKSTFTHQILKLFTALGAMSYSVYLLHGKSHMLPAMFVRQVVDEESVIYGIATVILTLLICYPFYLYCERPFMSSNYKKLILQTNNKKTLN